MGSVSGVHRWWVCSEAWRKRKSKNWMVTLQILTWSKRRWQETRRHARAIRSGLGCRMSLSASKFKEMKPVVVAQIPIHAPNCCTLLVNLDWQCYLTGAALLIEQIWELILLVPASCFEKYLILGDGRSEDTCTIGPFPGWEANRPECSVANAPYYSLRRQSRW